MNLAVRTLFTLKLLACSRLRIWTLIGLRRICL
nr:MAG TPA: hypothetical protein [Caudoviricetes sp.]